MYVSIFQLPDSARVWLYQAERQLTAAEVAVAESHLRAFCETWVAHGQPLRVSFAVVRNRFLLLAADEAAGAPSGCSIDSSVQTLRELGAKLDVELLDKSRIAALSALSEVEEVVTFTRPELRAAVAEGRLQPGTPVFDNTIGLLGAWRAGWPQPAAHTWLARYFVREK